VPRVCLICDLHPFLERWTESLIESGLSLRQVAAAMRIHSINVSYQAVNRHRRHMSRSEKIKRIALKFQRLRRRHPPLHETLDRFKKQRTQMRSWIKAERKPPKEAYKALHDLDRKIEQLSLAVQLKGRIKAWESMLRLSRLFRAK